MFVTHCRDRMAAFGTLSGAICVFILSMIHAPHMKMCNILTLTRAHKHTHTHASIPSHTQAHSYTKWNMQNVDNVDMNRLDLCLLYRPPSSSSSTHSFCGTCFLLLAKL